jgi:hypothetical protein
MDPITPEQFLENARSWEPPANFREKIEKHLRTVHLQEDLVPGFAQAFQECAQSTYDYIQCIHELATTKELDKKNLLPQVAFFVGRVHDLQRAAYLYQEVFKKFDTATRDLLTQDEFDTVYYDAIQNVELRALLKKIIDEVGVILQSFTLVSQELNGVEGLDLYESSIRFQLFLQYFMAKHKFSTEELWSILFDVYNQVTELAAVSVDPTEDELKDLQQKIQKFRNN